jgi:cobalt-zinc-cadmium resistance protein CzcA
MDRGAPSKVPGIADVTTFGGITTQFQLQLDPAALTRFNISLKNVTDAIQANSANPAERDDPWRAGLSFAA